MTFAQTHPAPTFQVRSVAAVLALRQRTDQGGSLMTTLPHSNQLRFGRYSQPGQIYLLTAITRDREPAFGRFETGRLVVDAFRKAQQEQFAHSLAWVVMPDHFPWLIELQGIGLSKLMARTNSRNKEPN